MHVCIFQLLVCIVLAIFTSIGDVIVLAENVTTTTTTMTTTTTAESEARGQNKPKIIRLAVGPQDVVIRPDNKVSVTCRVKVRVKPNSMLVLDPDSLRVSFTIVVAKDTIMPVTPRLPGVTLDTIQLPRNAKPGNDIAAAGETAVDKTRKYRLQAGLRLTLDGNEGIYDYLRYGTNTFNCKASVYTIRSNGNERRQRNSQTATNGTSIDEVSRRANNETSKRTRYSTSGSFKVHKILLEQAGVR